MIVDAGPMVALALDEASAPAIRQALAKADLLLMSAPTLTEVCIVRYRRAGTLPEATLADITAMDIKIVPVETSLAVAASVARVKYPIRFGDGFVYALAKERGLPILTLDAEFAKTDADLVPLSF